MVIPGVVLQQGADAELARDHYDGIKAHVDFLARQVLSPRTLSLLYIENTSVHRKICSRMVCKTAVDLGALTPMQVLSPRTLSLLYIENTSVHRKGV